MNCRPSVSTASFMLIATENVISCAAATFGRLRRTATAAHIRTTHTLETSASLAPRFIVPPLTLDIRFVLSPAIPYRRGQIDDPRRSPRPTRDRAGQDQAARAHR